MSETTTVRIYEADKDALEEEFEGRNWPAIIQKLRDNYE